MANGVATPAPTSHSTVIARAGGRSSTETVAIEPRGRVVLDAPVKPGHDSVLVANLSRCVRLRLTHPALQRGAGGFAMLVPSMWPATMRMAVASTAASSAKPRMGITSATKSNGRMK